MKKISLLIFSLFILTACSKDEDACSGIANEVWFEQWKANLDAECDIEVSIFKGIYEDEIVYYELITDPAVNFQAMFVFYNCSGEMVAELNMEESNDYLNAQHASNEKLYTCAN